MLIRADGKHKNLKSVGIRTSDPELATESFRDFSSESVLKISQWNGADFNFGYGVKKLPQSALSLGSSPGTSSAIAHRAGTRAHTGGAAADAEGDRAILRSLIGADHNLTPMLIDQ